MPSEAYIYKDLNQDLFIAIRHINNLIKYISKYNEIIIKKLFLILTIKNLIVKILQKKRLYCLRHFSGLPSG